MIRSGTTSLRDGELTLREVRRQDAADLYGWRMDPESRFMFHSTEVIPFETHLRFLERYFDADNSDAWFVVEVGGRAVGSIVLYDLSPDGSEAEWGRFVVAPAERGKGYGRRALVQLIRYARQRGIRRLRCDVLGANGSARKLYRSLGFVETGTEMHGGREFVCLRLDGAAS